MQDLAASLSQKGVSYKVGTQNVCVTVLTGKIQSSYERPLCRGKALPLCDLGQVPKTLLPFSYLLIKVITVSTTNFVVRIEVNEITVIKYFKQYLAHSGFSVTSNYIFVGY